MLFRLFPAPLCSVASACARSAESLTLRVHPVESKGAPTSRVGQRVNTHTIQRCCLRNQWEFLVDLNNGTMISRDGRDMGPLMYYLEIGAIISAVLLFHRYLNVPTCSVPQIGHPPYFYPHLIIRLSTAWWQPKNRFAEVRHRPLFLYLKN